MARKIKTLTPEHLVFGTDDGKLIELKAMPTPKEMKEQKLFHVVLLHHDASACVFYDPYEAWFHGDDEPRFVECDMLTLKEYLKLAKVYGGETVGSGWFDRHVSSATSRKRHSEGVLGAMNRCEEAMDSLIASIMRLQRQ